MSATTGRSAARTHRRACSTPRAIERESIRSGHLAGYAGILQADAFDGWAQPPLSSSTANPVRKPRRCCGLRSCAPEVLRTCRHRRQCAAEQNSDADLADRIRSRRDAGEDRRPLRHRARLAWPARPLRSLGWPPAEERPDPRRARRVDARQARQTLPANRVAEAIRYALTRWAGLTRYLDDGRIEIDNNVVERAIRGPSRSGQEDRLFAGR